MKQNFLITALDSLKTFFTVGAKKIVENEDGGHADRLIHKDTSSRVLEAYRMTRTNLMYTGKNDGGRVIGFTSASPHDGKSLTCANLAISFAMSGKRVLLIDCDMHRPTQNISFSPKAQTGLSEYLTDIVSKPEIVDTEYENLSLLTAGRCPPNPAELLYSERFSQLIANAKTEYDCVFLDLPPLNVISDAAIVSSHLDGYVFIVRAGKSDRRLVQSAIYSIEHVGGKVIGFVLNDTDRHVISYGRSGYYGGYYYSYDRRMKDGSEKKENSSKKESSSAKTSAKK
jgi:capsular exopolysaccharide synthesis family protein